MRIDVARVPVEEILALRELHREEMQCQIVHYSLPGRGLSHCYRLRIDGETVGYGTAVGFGDEPKDTIDEFFVRVERRGACTPLFRALVEESGATKIQAQTNDVLLTTMLFDHSVNLTQDRILFEDGFTSSLRGPGLTFRRAVEADCERLFAGKRLGDVGSWLLELEDQIVAAGGILFHYNPPYGDLYMEVAEPYRMRGYGSFLVQELKRDCIEMGKIPAARCNADNHASRATLQKAGMLPCGSIVVGEIAIRR